MAILLSIDASCRRAQPHVEIRAASGRARAAGRSARAARYAAIDAVVSIGAMLGFAAATLGSLQEIVPARESGSPGIAKPSSSPTCAAGPSALGAASL